MIITFLPTKKCNFPSPLGSLTVQTPFGSSNVRARIIEIGPVSAHIGHVRHAPVYIYPRVWANFFHSSLTFSASVSCWSSLPSVSLSLSVCVSSTPSSSSSSTKWSVRAALLKENDTVRWKVTTPLKQNSQKHSNGPAGRKPRLLALLRSDGRSSCYHFQR